MHSQFFENYIWPFQRICLFEGIGPILPTKITVIIGSVSCVVQCAIYIWSYVRLATAVLLKVTDTHTHAVTT